MSGFTLRRSRSAFWVLVALAAALALSFAVSPATAGTSSPTASWTDTCGADTFSSLDRLAESSTARGDVAREPALSQTATEIAPKKGRGAKFRVTVPTYVHVVHHADGTGNVSDKAINDQMNVLNMTFGGFEGGVATGFKFSLAGVTRTANTTWYLAGPTTSGERAMKQALRQGGDNALNVYLTTAGPYLGWAYFPNVLENATRYLDGVVVDWESMVKTSTRYAGQYDLGKTLPHEAGHWLNLHHVFNGGCNNFGDYVEDTPPQRIATFGCPEGQDSCREPGLDSIHNYMDYSFDACYNQFTAGQALRMQDAWLEWRA
jgi:hypothetical protein